MADPFEGTEPIVRELYDALLSRLETLGAFQTEVKKSSIHINRRAAFLGVRPKKTYLEVNVVSSSPLEQSRGYKVEQVSKNRFHNRIRLQQASDLSSTLLRDIASAYRLME